MDNGFRFQLRDTETDGLDADYLPLTPTTPISMVQNGSSDYSFKMPILHERTPNNWNTLMDPRNKYILIIHPKLPHPLGGMIVDTSTDGSGYVTIDCVTFEYGAENGSPVGDLEFVGKDLTSEIGVGIFEDFCESWSVTPRAIPSGLSRTRYTYDSEGRQSAEVANDQGFFWNVNLEWTDEAKSKVTKFLDIYMPSTGRSDKPDTGYIKIGNSGNVATVQKSGPVNAGKTATHLTVTGPDPLVRSVEAVNPLWVPGKPKDKLRVPAPAGVELVDDLNTHLDFIKGDFFEHRPWVVTLTVRETPTSSLKDVYRFRASVLVHIEEPGQDVFHEVMQIAGISLDTSTMLFTPTLIKTPKESAKYLITVDPMINVNQVAKNRAIKSSVSKLSSRVASSSGGGSGAGKGVIRHAVIIDTDGADSNYVTVRYLHGEDQNDFVALDDTNDTLERRRIAVISKNMDDENMPSVTSLTKRYLTEETRRLSASPIFLDFNNSMGYGDDVVCSGTIYDGIVKDTKMTDWSGNVIQGMGDVNPGSFRSYNSTLYTVERRVDQSPIILRWGGGAFSSAWAGSLEYLEIDGQIYPYDKYRGSAIVGGRYDQIGIVSATIIGDTIEIGQDSVSINVRVEKLDPIIDEFGLFKEFTISKVVRSDTSTALDIRRPVDRLIEVAASVSGDHLIFEISASQYGSQLETTSSLHYVDLSSEGGSPSVIGSDFYEYMGGSGLPYEIKMSDSGEVYGIRSNLEMSAVGGVYLQRRALGSAAPESIYIPMRDGYRIINCSVVKRQELDEFAFTSSGFEDQYPSGAAPASYAEAFRYKASGNSIIPFATLKGTTSGYSYGPIELPSGELVVNLAVPENSKMLRYNW